MSDVFADCQQLDMDYSRRVAEANDECRLVDRVRDVFRRRPGEWIDGRLLAEVGGYGGWRTRVSDCRKLFGMDIENRTRKQAGYTVSEYRYRRPAAGTEAVA